MKKLAALCGIIALALCGAINTGCVKTLDPSGVYQGDAFLEQSELAITTAHEVIHTYVLWEYQNRVNLAHIPAIKQSANAMRAHAKQWEATAHALHDAYKASPTAANKTALQAALDILRTALAEAAQYMSMAATAPVPPTPAIVPTH